MEPLPDFGSLSDDQLKELIGDAEQQEREISYQRRLLHGRIDILRAELVARLQVSGGRSVLDEVDVQRLTEILTGKSSPEGGPASSEESAASPERSGSSGSAS